MPTRFQLRVQYILEKATQVEPQFRDGFVTHACEGNAELLEEVRSLLPHYLKMANFEPAQPAAAEWRLPGTTTLHTFCEQALAAEEEPEVTPPFSIDQYTILEVLGRGGMGVVYRAVHPTLQRLVALKVLRRRVLSREDRWRFTFEEEILRQLRHVGIARFIHAGVTSLISGEPATADGDPRPFFVMEYVAGLPLSRFTTENKLSTRDRIELLARVCDAVEYAHHRGIVHCDLKPANILVEQTGQPKVLDFGIARIAAFESTLDSAAQRVACTPEYASPEQKAGRASELTAGSDVYALGLIAHELLTRQLPQCAGGRLKLNLDHVRLDGSETGTRATDDEFRYYLTGILATALRMTTGPRYSSAGELGADLTALLEHYPVATRWGRLKLRMSRLIAPRTQWTPHATRRPLSAVFRKRVAMAMESGAFRASRPHRAEPNTSSQNDA